MSSPQCSPNRYLLAIAGLLVIMAISIALAVVFPYQDLNAQSIRSNNFGEDDYGEEFVIDISSSSSSSSSSSVIVVEDDVEDGIDLASTNTVVGDPANPISDSLEIHNHNEENKMASDSLDNDNEVNEMASGGVADAETAPVENEIEALESSDGAVVDDSANSVFSDSLNNGGEMEVVEAETPLELEDENFEEMEEESVTVNNESSGNGENSEDLEELSNGVFDDLTNSDLGDSSVETTTPLELKDEKLEEIEEESAINQSSGDVENSEELEEPSNGAFDDSTNSDSEIEVVTPLELEDEKSEEVEEESAINQSIGNNVDSEPVEEDEESVDDSSSVAAAPDESTNNDQHSTHQSLFDHTPTATSNTTPLDITTAPTSTTADEDNNQLQCQSLLSEANVNADDLIDSSEYASLVKTLRELHDVAVANDETNDEYVDLSFNLKWNFVQLSCVCPALVDGLCCKDGNGIYVGEGVEEDSLEKVCEQTLGAVVVESENRGGKFGS